jgi:glutathione S-transferase
MLKLLGRKTSGNVQKVLFALEEMGADYTREDYGRLFENTTTPEYLSMNPTAKVPTLVDGDTVIWESNTILRYLADTRAPEMTGATPAERTEVERWMDFVLAAVNPGYMAGFKAAKLDPADRPAGFDAQIADLHAQMQIVSAHLEGKEFLALGKLTIADCALGPILGRCLNFPYDRPSMPGLEHWFAGISARPAFKAATG